MNKLINHHLANAMSVVILVLISTFGVAYGEMQRLTQPSSFEFTPTFKDPDPGKRVWRRQGDLYVENLPSGNQNKFRIYKNKTTVKALPGTIVQKLTELNFFVFFADSDAPRPELWWWRDKAPWNFMGRMKNVETPHTL